MRGPHMQRRRRLPRSAEVVDTMMSFLTIRMSEVQVGVDTILLPLLSLEFSFVLINGYYSVNVPGLPNVVRKHNVRCPCEAHDNW